jgi:hypothetical protein
MSLKLKQGRIIIFLHLKGLKHRKIATKLSRAYGQDVYAPPSRKYWIHEKNFWMTDLQKQYIGG